MIQSFVGVKDLIKINIHESMTPVFIQNLAAMP